MLTEAELARAASDTGFEIEPLGKVERLLALLAGLCSHPFLKRRVALKGGTALNLFVFDVPRLSVDIDLNYERAVDRETMLAERPKVEQAIAAVCGRLGMLRANVAPDREAIPDWTQALVTECRDLLSVVLPLDRRELEFLDALNDRGAIEPALLTEDVDLQDRIRAHPGLQWKAHNVRKHIGSLGDDQA